MALFFADMVREFSHSAGPGDFALEGALPGHRRFGAVVPSGARFHYAIAGITDPNEWETGEGEIASGGTLVRSPLASSVGGSLVSFSSGLKAVALTVGASWFAVQDQAVNVDLTALQAVIDDKAPIVHHHDGDYAAIGHGHNEDYAAISHDHDSDYASADHGHSFAALSGKPATLAGYGIEDAAAAGHDHGGSYQPLDAELTAIAGLASAADRLAYFTGSGAAALTPLTGFGRSLVDDADPTAGRATLGLGTAATRNTGTSGSSVPLLNGANQWGAVQTVSATNYPLLINSTNNNTLKLLFQDSGVTVGGFGASTASMFSVFDPTLTFTRFSVANNGGQPQLLLNDVPVVTTRRTGWGTPTGTATRTGFATASVTIEQLAERVKALIDDLRAHGLIGN